MSRGIWLTLPNHSSNVNLEAPRCWNNHYFTRDKLISVNKLC